jgi:hypothetical protein
MVGLLMGGDTQKVQRIGMSGIDADDFLIQGLCLFQLTRLMVLEGQLQRLRDRGHGDSFPQGMKTRTSSANHPPSAREFSSYLYRLRKLCGLSGLFGRDAGHGDSGVAPWRLDHAAGCDFVGGV